MKRALVLALVLVLVSCKKTEADEWVSVRRGDLELGVACTGKLVAVDSDLLGPPHIAEKWEFKIAMLAPEGATVKKGEPVVAFDTTDLKEKRDQKANERDTAVKEIEKAVATAALARRDEELKISEAEAAVRKAKLKLDRPEDLTASNELAIAKLDLELAEAELVHERAKATASRRRDEVAVARLQERKNRAEARVRETDADVDRLTVLAPRDATVIYRADEEDQKKKKVGDSVYREQKVLETATLDRMIATADVDEVDAAKPVVGQHVTLQLDALPDSSYGGKIAEIGATVQRQSQKSGVKIVHVEIALDGTDAVRMRPGMRFRGNIETGRVAQVVIVPSSAIFLTREGPVAYRKKRSGYETVRLELGRRNTTSVEVRSGLAPGDEVSTADKAREEKR